MQEPQKLTDNIAKLQEPQQSQIFQASPHIEQDETPCSDLNVFADVLRERPRGETAPQIMRPRSRRRLGERWQEMLHNPRNAVIGGIVASNGFALLVMLATYWATSHSGDSNGSGLFIASDFVLLPALMGGICAYFWQEAKLSTAAYILYGLLNTTLALLLSFLFLREGVICLIMASPLLIGFALMGGLVGRTIFKARRARLNAALVPLALALFLSDSMLPHNFENQETDRVIIHASPARVWQYIIDYPLNNAPSDYWLNGLGLPAPLQSTATGHAVGATRRCLFTGGIAFDEKITVVEPGRRLEFDVVTQPNHPEVVGHLVLQKGQFLLINNHDGTTTVTGTSWYRLNVYPVIYYDLWVQDVVRHVHLRVMRHIKMLAERPEERQ